MGVLNAVTTRGIRTVRTNTIIISTVDSCFCSVVYSVIARWRWARIGIRVASAAVYTFFITVLDTVKRSGFANIRTWKSTVYTSLHYQPIKLTPGTLAYIGLAKICFG